jgi:hypothetical protein
MRIVNQVVARLKAGALLVIVKDDDETMALQESLAAASPFGTPVVYSASQDAAMDALAELPEQSGVLILKGLLSCYSENPMTVRLIREVALQSPEGGGFSRLILLESASQDIPPSIMTDAEIVTPELPGVEDLKAELVGWMTSNELPADKMPDVVRHRFATAVLGLARHEAARLFSRCFVEEKTLDAAWLRTQKALMVTERLGGALSFEKPSEEEIGGLDNLSAWLDSRMRAFNNPKAKAFGLDEPKGVLNVGLPGTGKSLTAKTVARKAGLPLLRLDIGKLFGSLVGQSESQTRTAIQTAEACAPCVLWIDEIEKAFSGVAGGGSGDSGTSQRVFGTFLSWLNDKTAPVFVVATANRVEALPPELLRKGRFDEIFYVGNPALSERVDILRIHLRLRKQPEFELSALEALAVLSKGFNGAELAEAVKSGMFRAFSEDRELIPADVEAAIKETVPLSKTMAEEIKRLERWADGRARPASSATEGDGGSGLNRPQLWKGA